MTESVSPSPLNDLPTPVTPGPPTGSHEVFLGGVIIGVLCLLLLVLASTFGYFGYRLWQTAQTERATPSIQELGEKAAPVPTASTTPSPSTEMPPIPPTATAEKPPIIDKATLEVKVLNGGGARGSASTLTELLKKAGYTKATFGNTVANFTGTTIYHTSETLQAAELLKEEVVKTYPKVTLAPSKAGDKDTTLAPIVIILGAE